jgi:hypothetical protein
LSYDLRISQIAFGRKEGEMKQFSGLVGIVSIAMLAYASVAAAQATQQAGYPGAGVSGNAVGQVAGAGTGGTLPFTGLNLLFLVVGGALLLGVGALLGMRGRQHPSRP